MVPKTSHAKKFFYPLYLFSSASHAPISLI